MPAPDPPEAPRPDPFELLDAASWARLYEQTIAGEYLRWMRSWIARNPGRGFEAHLVAGTEPAPAAVVAGPADAIITDTLGLGFDGEVTDAVMDRIEDVFRRCGSVPEFEGSTYAHPSLLVKLRERAYRVCSYLHVFVRRLEEAPGVTGPPGVEIRPIDKSDPEQVALAARTIASGMESRDGDPSEPACTIAEQTVSFPESATFLATIDGEPAGGASCAIWPDHPLRANHLNLFGGATLPWARRRGIQSALMRARLRWGFERGARTASLDGKPGLATETNARRNGFTLVYSKAVFVREPF